MEYTGLKGINMLIEQLEELIMLAKVGKQTLKRKEVLEKWYSTEPGDMWENKKTGEQFVVTGCSTCNRIMGVGLNNDHKGYFENRNCKRITYKDIKNKKNKGNLF